MTNYFPSKHESSHNSLIVGIFTLVFLLVMASESYSQFNIPVANCQNISGTYTDLGTNGAVITTANFDDANSSAQNIGFTFNFNGQNFTQFVLNTNGFIRLGNSPPSSAALFFTTANSYTGGIFNSTSVNDRNLIAAFNHDLTGGTNPEYRVHTSGTAPNRKCVIQYKNVRDKTTTPVEQHASMNFQIILYESTNIIDIVYGIFTATTNADNWKSAAVGVKGSGNTAGQMIAVTKGSTTIYSAATFMSGNYTGNAFNFRNNILPDSGLTLRFVPIKPNDRAILQAYTLGKAPIPFGNPQTIRALVKNVGTNAMLASSCTLQISGANTFINIQPIPPLAAGDSVFLTFASFIPTNTGLNHASFSIPSDDNPMNNSITKVIETNLNSYSYAQGPIPAGGVGFNNATGDFVAKFTTNSTQSINQVDVNFSTGGQPFQLGIWKAHATTGAPDSLVHSTATYTSTAGVYTVLINPPVSISTGSFFVGVRQTGLTNVSFSYQAEVPIRSGTFYYTSPSGGTNWSDFAPNNHFRFMIEPKFALQTDVGITSVNPPSGTSLVAGTAYNLNAIVVNYGLSAQNNIPVKYNVNGGTASAPVNTSTSISQNDTTGIIFSGTNAFTPTTPGTYTLKVFTDLNGDLNLGNDTLTVIYQVVPAPMSNFPYSQNFTDPEHWSISGVANLWRYGIATGATGLTNDTAAMAAFYSTPPGPQAYLKSPAFNISQLSNPTLEFDLAYRTYINEDDTLEVLVSTDGGISFAPGNPPLYLKSYTSNPSLSTLTPDTAQFFPANITAWRKEIVSLAQFSSATSLMIAFKAKSDAGNNCWVDNFKIYQGVLPSVSTAPISNILSDSAVSGGDVTNAGSSVVITRGVCWSTQQNPTIADSCTVDGGGTGVFASQISGLTPSTTYYVRAYATNSTGTAYGNELSFTTLNPPALATLTTTAVSSVGANTAVSGGNITDNGNANITQRGVCWSTSPSPTLANYNTNDGTGSGSFISNITGLNPSTTYYVRAYAVNVAGTAYGNEISFTTNTTPSVVTASVSNIGFYNATSGGNVTSDGGETVTARGVCFAETSNPSLAGNHTVDGSGTGNFVSDMTGLVPGTVYYVRAYATNAAGTSYGSQEIFMTAVNSVEEINRLGIVYFTDEQTLYIRSRESGIIDKISVFDLSGRMIASYEQLKGNQDIEIHLPGLSPGIYMLQMFLEDRTLATKIIIR